MSTIAKIQNIDVSKHLQEFAQNGIFRAHNLLNG